MLQNKRLDVNNYDEQLQRMDSFIYTDVNQFYHR